MIQSFIGNLIIASNVSPGKHAEDQRPALFALEKTHGELADRPERALPVQVICGRRRPAPARLRHWPLLRDLRPNPLILK